MTNPLLDFSGLPRFDAIQPEHIGPAIDTLLAAAEAAVAHAEQVAPVRWDSFVVPLDDATERLWRAWGQVNHLQGVVNTPALREAYNTNLPKLTRFSSALGQNLALFAQYRALAATPEAAGDDAARRKVLDNALRDFRLGGAELGDADKQRFAAIQEELSALSAKFSQNVLDATDAWSLLIDEPSRLAGLPDDVVAAARAAADKDGQAGWKLTLQMPCYLPVQMYAEDRALRETLYRANAIRASEFGDPALDNSAAIERILALRGELAGLLGFASYAEYSLATKMARSPDEVLGFLRDLAARAKPYAQRDRAELEAYAREHLGLDELQAWDLAYASEKLKQARYSFSEQEVKHYFTEPKVLDGLFGVINDLYGLQVQADTAPVWHPDVRLFRVSDAQGRLVGQFYLDLYAREGKRGGAWMDDCRNRRDRADGVQTPLVYLVCNFGRGGDGKPATFTHNEVTTLFHEMGHGLHQLLTQVGELGVAGINGVEWDAVELPSQFMENFCWEWPRLQAMTAHVDSGEPLPRALFDKMLAAKNYQSGMFTVRQLEFALFDMQLHHAFDAAGDSMLQLLERVRDEVAVNRPPAWNRFPHQFSHIFAGGYGAGYYSYKWAEVLSADAYAAFEEAPDQLAATGARFLQEILARGGSRPALQNFTAFRGRAPELDALLRHSGMAG
ncbi:M3 family metallopeptidase [Xanthomonas translucens]|uniref:oligopeptidase A n=3 Tax=Xanthomonas campestris pv. translucens TaxID=343 RepID=A0A109HGG5_XANCT|nr:M3 family metallopeptidase [Xanthomonas translucens]KWV11710.1 oligopeptidase A [Xanthomonas translucens]MCC8446780.1 M3 family metallopeptidase [Xanthomonas translucens pv. translucens]QSQ31305.1 M3 family metallopeptidase [Xanthomonas translucens pv. translucens]QSQ32881.1 M3 family metallopeptidase [Xanthomonas translucens pv. translucens]QSQ46200.1 M3 family metallopeptidase [Xanthomonas translucens pv. translucens]